jgi:hypothetical protein
MTVNAELLRSAPNWRKSSFCVAGKCVEIAQENGLVVLRNSSKPGTQLSYTREEWQAFARGLEAGEFDEVFRRGGPQPFRSGRKKKRQDEPLPGISQWLPEGRLVTSPSNPWDYQDRQNSRAMSSDEALERQIKLDCHQDRMKWSAAMRHLVFSGGLLALGVALGALLTAAGFPLTIAAGITLSGVVSGLGGYGVRQWLISKLGRRYPSDHGGDQGDAQPGRWN